MIIIEVLSSTKGPNIAINAAIAITMILEDEDGSSM